MKFICTVSLQLSVFVVESMNRLTNITFPYTHD